MTREEAGGRLVRLDLRLARALRGGALASLTAVDVLLLGAPREHLHVGEGIERIGNVAWYEARYLEGSELKGYAVAKIRVKKGGKLPSGKVLPDYEEFPPESEFGKRADFYMPKSKAMLLDRIKYHFAVCF